MPPARPETFDASSTLSEAGITVVMVGSAANGPATTLTAVIETQTMSPAPSTIPAPGPDTSAAPAASSTSNEAGTTSAPAAPETPSENTPQASTTSPSLPPRPDITLLMIGSAGGRNPDHPNAPATTLTAVITPSTTLPSATWTPTIWGEWSPPPTSIPPDELMTYGTLEDLRPGTPPVLIVLLGITAAWTALFVWVALRLKTGEARDNAKERAKHTKWSGLEGRGSPMKQKGKGKKTVRIAEL